MTEEFNLSEQEIDDIDKSDIAVDRGFYSRQDVQYFIRLLKKKRKEAIVDGGLLGDYFDEVVKVSDIDKLAGDKLI